MQSQGGMKENSGVASHSGEMGTGCMGAISTAGIDHDEYCLLRSVHLFSNSDLPKMTVFTGEYGFSQYAMELPTAGSDGTFCSSVVI